VLDVFGQAPDAFVFRHAAPSDIYLFALVVTFGPPLALWAVTAPWRLAGTGPRRWAQVAACSVLVAAFAVLSGRELWSFQGVVLATWSIVMVAGFVAAYRVAAVRTWLAFLAFAAPVFVVLFLVSSPTSALLDGGSGVERADAGTPGSSDGPLVVMLVLDELPLRSLLDQEGSIDRQLFPNLAGLADDSVWYRNATSVAGGTWHAVPSLLTGRDPVKHEAPTSADHPDNVFTAFAPEYRVEAFEMLSRLCPTSVCEAAHIEGVASGVLPLLADSRSIYEELLVPSRRAADPVTSFVEATVSADPVGPAVDEDVEPGFDDIEANQPARYAAFLEMLDELGPDPSSTFAYLHLLVPHSPWRFYANGVEYEFGDDEFGRNFLDWADAPPAIDVARQRHLLQAIYADRLLGGILDELRAEGSYDDAVIVVASDHGTAFTPGESVRGTAIDADVAPVLAELMWVPLLVKSPDLVAGTVNDENVDITDVAPTLADLAGVELGYETDGRSIVSGDPRTDTEKWFYPVEMSPFGNILGPRYTIDGRVGLAATLDDNVGRFLPDRSDAQLRPYRFGPYPNLVGQRVDRLLVGDELDDEVILEHGADLGDWDGSGVVSGLLSGRLASGDSDATLAVTVDGVVAGVAETYEYGEPGSFVVLVAEPLLAAEGNEVRFYRVDGPPTDPRLSALVLDS
jgi:hypothetical protein